MSDSLCVVPNVVVAGLFPNNPPPPKVAPVWLVLPNSPVLDDAAGAVVLAVVPKVPPLPNVEVLLPPPNAPKPVEGFAPPNSGFAALLLLFVLAKAPVDLSQITGGTWQVSLTLTKTTRCTRGRTGSPQIPKHRIGGRLLLLVLTKGTCRNVA